MVAELPDRTVQYSLPVAGGRDGALCWLACLPWPQPQASHRGRSKEKAGGGGGGKEEKGDDAAARRRVDWAGWPSIGLDWIGRTARPRTAAAARIRCSGPDSVAHQVCRAAPRRAARRPAPPGIWQTAGISRRFCSRFALPDTRVNTVRAWFGSPLLLHLVGVLLTTLASGVRVLVLMETV